MDSIINNLAKQNKFWTQSMDSVNQLSISPHVKFLMAMKWICYGVSFSTFQDYLQMGELTARLCVAKGIMECPDIAEIYLRTPTREGATNTLEAVADVNLWIWNDSFGLPGGLNNINILERWPLLESMLNGSHCLINHSLIVNDEMFHLLWYLVGGIYPWLSRFLSNISVPTTVVDSNFLKWIESNTRISSVHLGV